MKITQTIENWHVSVNQNNPQLLDDLLADDAVFHSPVLHTPQQGKSLTKMYLSAAMYVFAESDFHYEKEIMQNNHAALEFVAQIDGIAT